MPSEPAFVFTIVAGPLPVVADIGVVFSLLIGDGDSKWGGGFSDFITGMADMVVESKVWLVYSSLAWRSLADCNPT